MMIPYGFPNKSPYVRIINRNTEFNVDPFYKNLRSPTDPKSFILNEVLSDIANWNPNKSIVNCKLLRFLLLLSLKNCSGNDFHLQNP